MSGIGSKNPYTGKWETRGGDSKAEIQEQLQKVVSERDALKQKV